MLSKSFKMESVAELSSYKAGSRLEEDDTVADCKGKVSNSPQ